MNRQILIACVPCLVALGVACVALRFILKASGARFQWRKLKEVHSCQQGGVQSLAFVLTLPMFLIIAQFIVQVNQLMMAVMVVNYAAYASSRAAAVWIPAEAGGLSQNRIGYPFRAGQQIRIRYQGGQVLAEDFPASQKFRQIFKAGALACATISPSRDLGYNLDSSNRDVANSMKTMYLQLVPSERANGRLEKRIQNKVAWTWQNTVVNFSFIDGRRLDPNSSDYLNGSRNLGYTYNPIDNDPPVRDDPYQVGWEDAITCQVTHNFALLPGPGRFLAKYLVRADGEPDQIAPKIDQSTSSTRERVYTTSIWASATATCEGLKSVVPYVQHP